jgi:predicted metalloprotease
MRWKLGRRSQNIDDRRGTSPSGGGFPMPRGFPMSRGARRGGLGGVGLLLLLLLGFCYGIDPGMLFQGDVVTNDPYAPAPRGAPSHVDDEMGQFVATVLGYTEDTWRDLFDRMGRQYREPTLVLFSSAVDSACGFAQAAMGPFYCPADEKLYIDLSFYREMRDRFGAPGDFAQAYVIAHEVGHHVQNLLGIAQEVQAVRQQASSAESNTLSVMMELQADCFAGVWANHTQKTHGFLEEGDLEEGLNAAAAIGDDRLQRQTQGYVVPDAFTHGSSAQRVQWLRQGLASGDLQTCDTFGAERL